MKKLFYFLILVVFTCFNCCDNDEPEHLPPATQTGANTFGCLVNGKVWVPQGNNGTANLDLYYDPYSSNGLLRVSAYHISNGVDQSMAFGGTDIVSVGTYLLSNSVPSPGATFNDLILGCNYNQPIDIISGQFTLTKLDVTNAIISGTFEFTFVKPDCSTINITQGRFDLRF